MFSGAELEAIINEAAILATLADKEFVEHEDLEEARDKVRYGRSRKSCAPCSSSWARRSSMPSRILVEAMGRTLASC